LRRCPRPRARPPASAAAATLRSTGYRRAMANAQPPITLCRYWVKPDKEAEFRALLARHWPTFQKLGLVLDDPPHLIFRGEDKERGIYYVETFPWKDQAAMERA